VRGRNSNNDLIREKLDWDYSMSLEEGIRRTYSWIYRQITLLEINSEIKTCKDEITVKDELKEESFFSKIMNWMDKDD